MRERINLIARRGRALAAVTAVAATLAIGAGASAPAAFANLPGRGCGWQPLPLQTGWVSQDSVWGTGDPSYCVQGDGMVYLSGSVADSGNDGDEFGVLPIGYRPANTIWLKVYTKYGALGTMRIQPDGEMFAYDGNAHGYTSLAGLSFIAASTTLQPLPLVNVWQSANGEFPGSGDPAYYEYNGVVHLSGAALGGIKTDPIAYVPPGAAVPNDCTITNTYTYTGLLGTLKVQSVSGYISASGGDTGDYTSLAGVSYLPSPAWSTVSLLNGWSAPGGECGDFTGGLRYELTGGVVYLSGLLDGTATNSGFEVGALPAEAAPVHDLYMSVNSQGGAANVIITPGGGIYLYPSPGHPTEQISLDNISYHTGS